MVQAGVEDGDDAAVGGAADQSPGALGEPYRRDGDADGGEPGATGGVDRLGTGRGDRLIGSWEREPVDHHELARVAGGVDPLPQRHHTEQAAALGVPETAY